MTCDCFFLENCFYALEEECIGSSLPFTTKRPLFVKHILKSCVEDNIRTKVWKKWLKSSTIWITSTTCYVGEWYHLISKLLWLSWRSEQIVWRWWMIAGKERGPQLHKEKPKPTFKPKHPQEISKIYNLNLPKWMFPFECFRYILAPSKIRGNLHTFSVLKN